jgi:hypothetical protein
MNRWVRLVESLSLDAPSIALAVVITAIAYIIASALDLEPAVLETVWFGLCQAGFNYHWSGLHELQHDRIAIIRWSEADEVDLAANRNQMRRERARLFVKAFFGLAGLLSMLIPPRPVVDEPSEAQLVMLMGQCIVVFLIGAVVTLDLDAVMDRRARRHQMDLLRKQVQRRQARRQSLEKRFQPVFQLYVSETSEHGRELAHQINDKMAILVGSIEHLQQSQSCSPGDREFIMMAAEALEDAVDLMGEMQALMRGFTFPEADYTSSEEP